MVAVREEALGLDATEYAISPVAPVPVEPDVIVNHAALEVAVQPHELPLVEMVTLPVPPEEAKLALAGVSPVTAHAAAAWVTVWVWPPAVIVAVRLAAFGLEATEYAISPVSPVPVQPEVIVNHAALLVAVQPHELPFVEMVTLPLPPLALNDAVAGLRLVTVHAEPSWVTVWVWPPAVIVAVRLAALALDATLYAISPVSPVPVEPEVIVSHAALEVAVQPHELPLVEMVTLPLPPEAPYDALAGLRPVTVHAEPS